MKFTNNFSLDEMLISGAAYRYKYHEQFTPSENVIQNLKELCESILQPLRDDLGVPIHVSSGYRCKRVNDKIGGVKSSQHVKGQAADIQVSGISTIDVCKKVLDLGIDFDQMIEEYGSWVHISFNARNNRKQVLQKAKGTGYRIYDPFK
jgi:zinc D-Ala-D-Ala carboxypeptidase